MKEDIKNIDKHYMDALSNYEGKTSALFKIKVHLLLLYLRIRALMAIFLILSVIGILSYFGHGLLYDNTTNSTGSKPETSVEAQSNPGNNETANNTLFVVDAQSNKPDNASNREDPIERKRKPASLSNTKKPSDKLEMPTNSGLEKMPMNLSVLKTGAVTAVVNNKSMEKIDERGKLSPINDGISVTNNENRSPTVVPSDAPAKNHWFTLSIYASPTVTWAKLKSGNGFDDYLKLRCNNESPALSWSAGADVQVHWKNWFVQTGLNRSVYKNYKNYNYDYPVLDSANCYFDYDTVWVWIYNPPELGYPVMVGIDTVWVPVYENINVEDKGNNAWNYLEIPVLIGYQFNRRRFGLEVATGVSMGFLINAKGSLPRLPDAEGMEDLDGLSGEINPTMFSYVLRAGISYRINSGWSVIAQPYYKQNLRSVFKNNYPIDQKFRAFGLNFGVRARF